MEHVKGLARHQQDWQQELIPTKEIMSDYLFKAGRNLFTKEQCDNFAKLLTAWSKTGESK
jgi:hypothetical protein